MLTHPCRPFASLLITLLVAAVAVGQEAADPLPTIQAPRSEKSAELKTIKEVAIDIDRLLAEPVVIDSVDGPVWQVRREPGKYLVRLPVLLPDVKEPADFSDKILDISRGRFIAYQLVGLKEAIEDMTLEEIDTALHP